MEEKIFQLKQKEMMIILLLVLEDIIQIIIIKQKKIFIFHKMKDLKNLNKMNIKKKLVQGLMILI